MRGWFDETLTDDTADRLAIRKLSMIMVDCDLYSSAKTALDFCAPRIHDHAVMLLDDWWPRGLGARDVGEKKAFEEFLDEHPEFSARELDSYYPAAAKVFLITRA